MKYICLVYQEEDCLSTLPPDERASWVSDVNSYVESLQESGHFIDAAPLQSPHSATTLRLRQGQVLISDGPYAETREQIGGYYLIEATDLNDAIRVASKMPQMRTGTIEVRPLRTPSSQSTA
ncbi:MAG: YciI family protein [Thermomicrobiales bacterium]|nr:YciI family protein [Thermomicrobiales bacterium]